MATGKHSSSEWTITIADASGSNRVITGGVLTMGGLKITSPAELATAFGDSWDKSIPSGVRKMDVIKLTGHQDDTPTTGTHVVLGAPDPTPQSASRAFIVVTGGGTLTTTVFVTDYAVIGVPGKTNKFECTLTPTSTATWS